MCLRQDYQVCGGLELRGTMPVEPCWGTASLTALARSANIVANHGNRQRDGLAAALDGIRRIRPLTYPLTRDAAEIMTTMVASDDSITLDSLGLVLRPVRESLEETVGWLAEAGHLPSKNAGKLAPTAT